MKIFIDKQSQLLKSAAIFIFATGFCCSLFAQRTDAQIINTLNADGQNIQKNKDLFEKSLQKANSNDPQGMTGVGICYRYGIGVTINYAEALKWFTKAASLNEPQGIFNLGEMYKYGNGVNVNYTTATGNFKRAADLNYPDAIYAEGFMLHKGFGCIQNYEKACILFKKGASLNNAPSMFMLGISYRNGYGIPVNADSATYWLTKAANMNYSYATEELQAKNPENNSTSAALAEKIKDAKKSTAPQSTPINQYIKTETKIAADKITGTYQGYLIKYDWSGKHIIDADTLTLQLNYTDSHLFGFWKESNNSIRLNARVTKNGLIFDSMQYRKPDHYNVKHPLLYNFENANLQTVVSGDVVYLTGNLQLYSPESVEPEKPFGIALIRISKGSDTDMIKLVNEDGSEIKTKDNLQIYPNPFNDIVNVHFTLKKACIVFTQFISMDGKVLYTTPTANLTEGEYNLAMQPKIPAGAYIIKLQTGNTIQTAKAIKLN